MPAPLMHTGVQVSCAHGGTATPTAPDPSVTITGQPVVTFLAPFSYSILGCAFPPPPAGNGPCVQGQLASPSTRIRVNGKPVVLMQGPGVCAPTGTPLLPIGPPSTVVGI
jgi:hypothetical protein